jgi:Glutaredoxin
LLSSWGITFEAIDVAGNPAALEELKRVGVPLVPAVVVGERIVHGWNPRGYAELLGVPYHEGPQLSPAELAERLERVLQATQQVMRQIPAHQLYIVISITIQPAPRLPGKPSPSPGLPP